MINALDMQRARASALARDLVARSPGDSIACIFAGGSLSRGEVWAAEIAGELEIYSDVDLHVVVRDDAPLAPVRAAAAAVASNPPGIDGVHFLRAPDVGVYTRADLRAQPARPGTIDLAVHHLVLHGDRDLPRELPPADMARIEPVEALYLLENRLAELAVGDGSGSRNTRLRMIRALKARLDVDAAHAIVARTFVPASGARAQRFASHPAASLDERARDDIADAYRAAADLAAWLGGRDESGEVERARGAVARAWRALAPGVLNAPADTAIEALVGRRCSEGSRRKNAREAVRLRRAGGLPLGRALAAAPSLSRLSPRAALRLDALVRQYHAAGEFDARRLRAHERYVERLTRRFGFTHGSLETRVHAMHRVIS